jgi:hypothetical protein
MIVTIHVHLVRKIKKETGAIPPQCGQRLHHVQVMISCGFAHADNIQQKLCL